MKCKIANNCQCDFQMGNIVKKGLVKKEEGGGINLT